MNVMLDTNRLNILPLIFTIKGCLVLGSPGASVVTCGGDYKTQFYGEKNVG